MNNPIARSKTSPLARLKSVMELVGIGATPFCTMMLVHMEAEVIRGDFCAAEIDALTP
jgi:crotonobetainyl-CoA:carnitine CoA-transferase CaiB-like acyl-CoA transferase